MSISNLRVFTRSDLTVEGPYLVSPVVSTDRPYTRWVPSLNIPGYPPQPSVLSMRWGSEGVWTQWRKQYAMGPEGGRTFSKFEQLENSDQNAVDRIDQPTRCQMRVQISDTTALRTMAVTYYSENDLRPCDCERSSVWGHQVPVWPISQRAEDAHKERYPRVLEGFVGKHICASVSLATASFAIGSFYEYGVRPCDVARLGFDPVTGLYGVWSLNAVAICSLTGALCYVASLHTLAEIEQEIQAGYPVVTSIAWEEGWLNNATQSRTLGHLVVVIGFTKSGEVIVCDPNVDNPQDAVRIFRRHEFYAAWQNRFRLAYLLRRAEN